MKKLIYLSFALLCITCSDDESTIPGPLAPDAVIVSPPDETEDPVEEVFGTYLEDMTTDSQATWTWLNHETMYSRDGNTIGYGASMDQSSSKVIVFLEGGGACFNPVTCQSNPAGITDQEITDFMAYANFDGLKLMSRSMNANKFKDWNHIYVPYVTGDVHSGTNANATVPLGGPADQKMVGYDNITQIVTDLYDYSQVHDIDEIVIAGSSAGGFGVYLNFIQFADKFPDVQLTGLVDAGPVMMDETILTPCLNYRWESLFDFNFPADYDQYVSGDYDYTIQGIYEYLENKYTNANFGLLSNYEDQVIRFFYSFGPEGCLSNPLDPTTGAISVSASEYRTGLMELQNYFSTLNNWNVYYVNGSSHTFLRGDLYEGTTVNGTNLVDWVGNVVDGTATDVME